MSKGFFSKIDITKYINLEKEDLLALMKNKPIKGLAKEQEKVQTEQLKNIKLHSDIEAEMFVPETEPCPKPGAKPSHNENPRPSKLKVENGLTSVAVNGKTFDMLENSIDEYER